MATDPDPTRIREQPALTSSRGAIWLIVGGIFTVIALAVLIPMTALPGGVFALVAAIVDGVVYLGMIVTTFAIPPGRRRLRVLAVGLLVIAGVSLVAAAIVASSALSASSALPASIAVSAVS